MFTGSMKIVQSFIVNLLLYVPCFQIDQLTVQLYKVVHFESQSAISNLLYVYRYDFSIICDKVSQTISFQFDINTFNNNIS